MAILTTPKQHKTGDKVTAKVINDVIETAVEAYRNIAVAFTNASPFDWSNLHFNIDGNSDLILNYNGAGTLNSYIDGSGYLILETN